MTTPDEPAPPSEAAALPAPPCALPDDAPRPTRDLGSFYQATLAPLRNYLARLLSDRTEAQDVAHEAYLKTFKAMNKQEVQEPAALLYTTARNLAFTDRKRRQSRTELIDPAAFEDQVDLAPPIGDAVSAEEQSRLVREAILSLPATTREVMNLRYFEGLRVAAIAKRLEISESAIEKHLIRGLKALRDQFRKSDE